MKFKTTIKKNYTIVFKDEITSVDGIVYYRDQKLPFSGKVYFRSKDVEFIDDDGVKTKPSEEDIVLTIEYRNGIPNGEYIWFFFDGKTITEKGFYQNGKKHGLCTKWYEEGIQKKSEGEFINGKKNGIWKGWDRNGKQIYKERWENGKLISE